MRMQRLAITTALAVIASACGPSIQVTSDWDPAVDFSQYQTFAVLDEAPGSAQIDQLTRGRIKNAIASTLVAKGMRQVEDPDNADAAVGWQLTTDERSSFQTVTTGWGGYGRYGRAGWYGTGGGMATSTTTETRYEVGTLVVALFDESKDQMIFMGSGSRELASGNLSPEESQRRINEAVEGILKDFPPGG
ncbi:MAG: DUF4136 domain-containing protein [Gemmatimonadota bacterium]|nr:MAG: DUF4136 domain-containing protein [Gemmatimonadota bacterium]